MTVPDFRVPLQLLRQRCGEKQVKKGGSGGTTSVETALAKTHVRYRYMKGGCFAVVLGGWTYEKTPQIAI
jgi:hypothetical protein